MRIFVLYRRPNGWTEWAVEGTHMYPGAGGNIGQTISKICVFQKLFFFRK